MKTTVTEEFDADGTLTKRTTVTEDGYASGGYVGPFTGGGFPSAHCTCSQPWGSITAPPSCPVHGQAMPATITCGSNTGGMWDGVLRKVTEAAEAPSITVNVDTNADPADIASEVGWTLRSMS